MATTTNYGWTTPDDTALVKDGASAIRTLGTSVDTTTKNLNPETTLGDVSFRSSTSNVNTRLGIGSTGQVLTVAAGVPSWATISAGGMTLLSTTTLSGASTTISSISQSYNSLFMVITGVTNATATGNFSIRPNNATANITQVNILQSAATMQSQDTFNLGQSNATSGYGMLYTSTQNSISVQIDNYASTTSKKPYRTYGAFEIDDTNIRACFSAGGIQTNTAITSLVFLNSGGNLSTGTVLLYGVK